MKAFHSILTKILAAALSLTALCCAAACGGEKPAEEKVEISLSETEIELYEGESVRLTVTVTPADVKDKTITWRSTDSAIAAVDEEGVVTGKKAGETTVTASTNEKSVTCKVKVKAKEDSSDSTSSDTGSSDTGSDSENESESGSSESESSSENGSESGTENSSEE